MPDTGLLPATAIQHNGYVRGEEFLTQVQVRPNESLDSALKRFKKVIQQTGILKEAREHEHYEKPSDKKRKAAAAARRKRERNEEKEKV